MDFVFELSLCGALVNVIGFLAYNQKIISGMIRPNMATWILFSFLSVLNLASYLVITQDIIKSLLPLVSTIATLSVLIIAVVKGQFSRLNAYDNWALLIGAMSGLAWLIFKSAGVANLILQISIIISFIPAYRGIMKGDNIEKVFPWLVWTVSYVLMALVVVFKNGQGIEYQGIEYIYPVVVGMLHLGVGMLCVKNPVKQSFLNLLG